MCVGHLCVLEWTCIVRVEEGTCTCKFATKWGFNHVTSSPWYPQSNGKAEATVKSMKKIICAAWNGRQLDEDMLCRALLQYHNTPSRKDGFSPAQKLYGRPVQDTPSPQTVIRNGQNRTVHQGGGRSLIQQTCTRPTWCWTRVKRHHTKSKN